MEDIRDLKLLRKAIKESEAKMWKAAQEWRYEEAARHKKTLRHYQKLEEQLL